MTVNQRLKKIQNSLNFKSQSDFAKALGIQQGSLSDIYREKKGVGVSDSIKMKLFKEYSINIEWLETGKGKMYNSDIQKNNNENSDNNISNNIKGKIKGNLTITHNDLTKLIELQKGSQEINIELNERLKTSQNQIDTLLEILKTKKI